MYSTFFIVIRLFFRLDCEPCVSTLVDLERRHVPQRALRRSPSSVGTIQRGDSDKVVPKTKPVSDVNKLLEIL